MEGCPTSREQVQSLVACVAGIEGLNNGAWGLTTEIRNPDSVLAAGSL